MLRERMIWMAKPSSFNDPFDCQPSNLRNPEIERRDRATIIKNHLRQIKRALRTDAQLADRQLQPIAHRTLVELRQFLQSPHTDDKKYNALKRYFVVPPDGDAALSE